MLFKETIQKSQIFQYFNALHLILACIYASVLIFSKFLTCLDFVIFLFCHMLVVCGVVLLRCMSSTFELLSRHDLTNNEKATKTLLFQEIMPKCIWSQVWLKEVIKLKPKWALRKSKQILSPRTLCFFLLVKHTERKYFHWWTFTLDQSVLWCLKKKKKHPSTF